jgi:hypothetical protein
LSRLVRRAVIVVDVPFTTPGCSERHIHHKAGRQQLVLMLLKAPV